MNRCNWSLLEVLPTPDGDTYVRFCPRCQSARPADEFVCQNASAEIPPPQTTLAHENAGISVPASIQAAQCRNGHPMEAGEFMCMQCGEPAAPTPALVSAASDAAQVETGPRVLHGWTVEADLPAIAGEADLFLVSREKASGDDRDRGTLKHYHRGIEPQASLYAALRALDPDHGARLLDSGRVEERAVEVWEYLPLGTLGAIPVEEKAAPDFVRQTVREIGGALRGLAQVEIIHRDLKPGSILVRTRTPLDLVLADFNTATVSEFDLQLSVIRLATRYAAPEMIAGTCSAASDWWSLGVILLEMLTKGRGFQGVHERAFLLHLVTRGLQVPVDLPEDWRELLMGLLTRDPSRRWSWAEVERWLGGERGIPHGYVDELTTPSFGEPLRLGGKARSTPESFALAAVDAACWDEARELLQGGRIATWLQQRGGERGEVRAAQVRSLASDLGLPEDARLATALLVLNDNLPLCLRGEMVTPNWVLAHPEIALSWLDSPLPARLLRLGREAWFTRLRERADRVRARVRELSLACDEAQLSAALLATSRTMLESRWRERRRLFPEADHPGLAGAMERRTASEEDLILLVSAPLDAFRPAIEVLQEAESEAARAQVAFSVEDGQALLQASRREILDTLNERLRNFVRCGRETADLWADDFRQDRRITLARALVLLSVPVAEWREPPRQEYVRNILAFFHRRLVTGLQRGGLVRMTIGRTTARLDLTELGGSQRTAEELLAGVVARRDDANSMDPGPLLADPQREQRLRRLIQNAAAYRRDTGINALYLGFPFVTLRDARATDAAKPRIAPVLLWPVRLEMPAGRRATVRLAFDTERNEVRMNPALEGLLGGAAPAWREALDEVLSRDNLGLQTVVDALVPLAPLPTSEVSVGSVSAPRLRPLPPATVRVAAGQIHLHASAVLFHSDFSGQTIAEDLKKLTMRAIQGTSLEFAVRAGLSGTVRGIVAEPPEIDRYFTAESDPSQQSAVFQARQAPGLVIQGPPGTGKSQTIVNIVCDALGRGERVLIVCQKLAALEVVEKRLKAEGLAERILFLRDPVSDRRITLESLRNQLQQPSRGVGEDERLRREREAWARHIEAIEAELNSAHRALRTCAPEQPGGLPYRELLEKLLEVERGLQPPISFSALGAQLRSLSFPAAEQLISEIAPLTPVWRDSSYENSPLHCLANFRTDAATLEDFRQAFEALQRAEIGRYELLHAHERFFDLDTPEPLQRWMADHEAALRSLPPAVAQSLARGSALFAQVSGETAAPVEQLLPWLEAFEQRLRVLDAWTMDPALYEKLATRGNAPLTSLATQAQRLATPVSSIIARLNPARWMVRWRLVKWLRAAGLDPDAIDFNTLHAAAELELAVRAERPALQQWREALGDDGLDVPQPLHVLRRTVRRMIERLQPAILAARRVQACPVSHVSEELRLAGNPQACESVLDACRASLAMWVANRESATRLAAAATWFDPGWIATRKQTLEERTTGADSLEEMAAAFPSLPAFQAFRLRARTLNPSAFPLLALLRERDAVWQRLKSSELPVEIARTLRREALLAWKEAAEEICPALVMDRSEHEEKVRLLAEKDGAMREANRRLLVKCSPAVPLAPRGDWDDVVMFTGPRARRLREVVERGEPLGLFHLRPVWLVNPEMVSRLFPLQAGLFDVVVFDEASQLPVEAVLPALFRARRVIVSGDEKQMPPSRFFGAQLESDEEEGGDEWQEADEEVNDEAERERLAQAAGRREVKDCPDLLTLTQNLLPTATLEIHYRSQYRQLIDFSNAAFYGGRLNVPARHPTAEVHRIRPIEVDRVDGLYADQTNEDEANRIVTRLREIWAAPFDQRPSIGVVSFNLKQAELIQDKLETLAETDDAFRQAWAQEQVRTQRGEDMGFFVKNLENVQGDERDWILFSTTFGRDRVRVFRRNFGVLGQRGGERRLNVAITRAREKMIVVTSMPVSEISAWLGSHARRPPTIPRDYLQAWLRYVEHISAGAFEAADELLDTLAPERNPVRGHGRLAPASAFEAETAELLQSFGVNPVRAQGDAFGVDFALVDPRTGLFGLGIECDAPSHPMLETARAREMWRPSVLKASIPMMHRITSRGWYLHRDEERQRLKSAVRAALET